MNVAGIIDLWPSAEHFAADIGLKYPSYGRVLKMRGRIPASHWDNVLEAAKARSIVITRDDLERAHAEPTAPHADPASAV